MCHFLSMNCNDFMLYKKAKSWQNKGFDSIIKTRVSLANLGH